LEEKVNSSLLLKRENLIKIVFFPSFGEKTKRKKERKFLKLLKSNRKVRLIWIY